MRWRWISCAHFSTRRFEFVKLQRITLNANAHRPQSCAERDRERRHYSDRCLSVSADGVKSSCAMRLASRQPETPDLLAPTEPHGYKFDNAQIHYRRSYSHAHASECALHAVEARLTVVDLLAQSSRRVSECPARLFSSQQTNELGSEATMTMQSEMNGASISRRFRAERRTLQCQWHTSCCGRCEHLIPTGVNGYFQALRSNVAFCFVATVRAPNIGRTSNSASER